MYPREYIRKHYKAFLLFAGACAVCLSLGMNMVILPWYDKQYGMKPKDVQVLGDDPSDNFFTETYPSIEGGFIRTAIIADKAIQFLKKHIGWRLEAYYSSAWHEVSGLEVKTVDSGDGNWKVTINFTASISPRARYRAFFGTDLPAKWFNIDTQNTTITLSHEAFGHDFKFIFNYSDLKQYVTRFPHLTFNNGFNGDLLWFSMTTTDQINKGVHVSLDPTYGLIGDAVTNSWEYNKLNGQYPDMIRLGTSEYYAIVNSGNGNDGFINTTRVWNNNGTIQTSCVDSLEYDTTDGNYPRIAWVSGDIYAIAYRDTAKVTVVTINIDDADGQIAAAVTDTLILSLAGANSGLDFIRVKDNVFATIYSDGTNLKLYIETMWISNSGAINDTTLDVQIAETLDAMNPRACMVDSDTVAVVYDGGTSKGNDGFLVTYNISAAGVITNTNASSWEFDTDNGVTPTIQKVTGNVYMVGYQTSSTDLYVKTFRINNTGSIWTVWKDTQAFDTTFGWSPTLFNVSYNAIPNKWIKGISFVGTGTDVWISTFDVNSTGYITSEIDTLTFGADTVAWYIPTCFVSGFYFLSIHQDASIDGWAKTFQIYANNPPTISNPSPANGATGIVTTPQLSVNVSDYGDYLNATWSSNSSGSWHNFGTNQSIPSYGAISDTNIDSWEFNGDTGVKVNVIRLGTSNYYATVYTGPNSDGFINITKVWNINGTIQKTKVDSWEYDTTDGSFPGICLVNGSSDIYAIAYQDGTENKVVTIKMWSNNGTIQKSIISTLTLMRTSSSTLSNDQNFEIMFITNNLYVVVYMNASSSTSRLWIETFNITSLGIIGGSSSSVQIHSTTSINKFAQICRIDSDTIAIVYFDAATYDGYLSTYNISSTGIITNTSFWEFFSTATVTTPYSDIVKINNDKYAIVFRDDSGDGWIKTCTISNAGIITKSWISTYEFDSADCAYPDITSLNNNLFVITYQGVSADGFVKTLKITDDGIIACFEYDTLEFDTADSMTQATIANCDNDYYLIVYSGTGNDGWSCTVKIGNDTTTTLKQTNANFSAASTKYYWRVNVSDGVNANYSIYSFTTAGGGEPQPQWNSIEEWNGSLYTVANWNTVADWNGSLYTSSAWQTTSEWNGSLYVSPSFHTVNDWNGSLYVSTAWNSVNDWNGSLYVLSAWHTTNDWNGSLYYSATFNTINDWNGSLYVNASWHTTNNWNGSLYTLSTWQTTNEWNGSLYVSTAWNTVNDWNGSLYAVYSWHTDYEWNGSLYTTEVGDNITISDPHPANNSIHIRLNVTLSITITNRLGYNMNITWYWGNSSANATHYLGSTLNIGNGTYHMQMYPANQSNVTYYWNVSVLDTHLNHAGAVFNFETVNAGAGMMIINQDRFTLGLSIGATFFFILGMILWERKRKKQ